ncbi:sulfotransferase [Candidatus Pelagibacter bacterium]|nr:sulfotransferase [Candidatus Pelagibacter bacterium]
MDENLGINSLFEKVNENLAKKNFSLAEDNLKKILDIDENNLKALFILGSVFIQTEQLDSAIDYLNKVNNIDPNIANVHNNLGIVYIKLKKFQDAKKFFNKTLEINPSHLDAYNSLGIVYAELGDLNQALFNVKKVLELNSNFVSAHNNLGLIYKKFEHFNEAETSFKKAIEIDFKFIESHYNLMELYEKGNQNDKLESIVNNFEKLFKANSITSLYRGHILYKKDLFLEAIKSLESFSIENNINLEVDRINLLGKSYDKIGNINDAFLSFEKANLLNTNLKIEGINKNNFLNEIKIRINYFKNIKIVEKLPKQSQNYQDPVFMIGFPRSGTTLLDTILRSHPMIEVIEEKSSVKKIVNSLNKLSNNIFEGFNNIKDVNIKEIRKNYFEDLLSYINHHDKDFIYIDKLPLNIVYIAEILKIFPHAKFIISLRHPCDCILSCYMQNFKLNDSMSNFLNLKDTAVTYDLIMNLLKIYKSKFNFNFYEIKYENLISKFDNEIKNLLGFLELPWNDSVLEYQKTASERERIFTPSYDQVIKPLYLKSAGRWKKYENKLSNVYPILEPWIKEFKYE